MSENVHSREITLVYKQKEPPTNMKFTLSVLALLLLIHDSFCNFYQENKIFYQAPFLNINYTNVTFGMSVPLSKIRGSYAYQSYAGGLIATVCQADQLNQKLYSPINFNGIINFAAQDYNSADQQGQFATFSLLKNDLFNRTTGKSLSDENISNFAGFVGVSSAGRNRINLDISAGFLMPFVNPGTLDQIDSSDEYLIYSKVENRTVYSVRDTIIYSNINVIINLMRAHNWTIGSNIFQNNVLGQTGQQAIQTFQSQSLNPLFVCNSILTNNYIKDTEYYVNFCQCVTGINTLSVVNIFAVSQVAYEVILQLKNNCKQAKNFIFIIVGESQPLPPKVYQNPDNF